MLRWKSREENEVPAGGGQVETVGKSLSAGDVWEKKQMSFVF